jgi:hypothetical protein
MMAHRPGAVRYIASDLVNILLHEPCYCGDGSYRHRDVYPTAIFGTVEHKGAIASTVALH